MMMKSFLILVYLSCGLSLPAKTAEQPNVVIIFIDDMGFGDVGFNGATGPKTPHLDQMAEEGMRFNHFYVGCSVCSGSRTALMTGCHYERLSMPAVLFPHSKQGLHPDEVTIADMLKDSGYRTACVGKWHLGHLPPCLPTYHGFDSYYGIPYSNDMWIDPANKLSESLVVREGLTLAEIKAGHKKKNLVPLMRGEEVIEYPVDQATVTKRYTEEAIRFIKKAEGEPFFLYLPHTMVHLPLYVSEDFENRTEKLIWNAIEEIDWSVGQILSTLKQLKLAENTLVLFTSDNGAAVGSSLPLRAKKGSVYEGGVREPTVMWWPGTIPSNSVCEEVAATIDMLPTLAEICGGKLPKKPIDGKDIRALMMGDKNAKSPHDYYTLMHQKGAVRSGPWKYYPWPDGQDKRGNQPNRKISSGPVQLYHVLDDIDERYNVASNHPDLVKEFQSAFDAHVSKIKSNQRPTIDMIRPEGMEPPSRPNRKSKEKSNGKAIQWNKIKVGNSYGSNRAPNLSQTAFSISATIEGDNTQGIVVSHGGSVVGYALYITQDNRCIFAVRNPKSEVKRVEQPITDGKHTITCGIDTKGNLHLQIDEGKTITEKANLLEKHPSESLDIGMDDANPVDENAPKGTFTGSLLKLSISEAK